MGTARTNGNLLALPYNWQQLKKHFSPEKVTVGSRYKSTAARPLPRPSYVLCIGAKVSRYQLITEQRRYCAKQTFRADAGETVSEKISSESHDETFSHTKADVGIINPWLEDRNSFTGAGGSTLLYLAAVGCSSAAGPSAASTPWCSTQPPGRHTAAAAASSGSSPPSVARLWPTTAPRTAPPAGRYSHRGSTASQTARRKPPPPPPLADCSRSLSSSGDG